MIFIGGISSGRRELKYSKMVICSQCGSYGRYQVFMTYTYFSFFFIPLFQWNKQFFVTMSCCQSLYQLDQEVGRRLLRGEEADITEKDLTLVQSGRGPGYGRKKICPECGYETTENFDFCPICGKQLISEES